MYIVREYMSYTERFNKCYNILLKCNLYAHFKILFILSVINTKY